MTAADEIKAALIADHDAVYAAGHSKGQAAGYSYGYENGYRDGGAEGYTTGVNDGRAEGIEQGKQAQREAWWNDFTAGGTRTNFGGTFAGAWWTDVTYDPPNILAPTNANNMFENCKISKRKVEVDFSQATSIYRVFRATTIEHIGVCDFRGVVISSSIAGATGDAFSFSSQLHTIDEIIIDEDFIFSTPFGYCHNLKNLKLSGTLATDGFDTKHCIRLSRASHESIMAAVSLTASITVTFSKTAVDKAFETAEGANDGSTSEAWAALEDTRQNCTVKLA